MLKFSANADYKTVLTRLKGDFDKKWKDMKPSTADQLQDYDDIRVLGSGAFGVVVSWNFSQKFHSHKKIIFNRNSLKAKHLASISL